jgi:type I restriction enzyme M protein
MKLTLQQLEAHLWGAANILRGKTAGQDYKNYILSLMFFKRLCDQWECEADDAIAEQERQQGRSLTEKQKAIFRKRGEHRFNIPDGSRWSDVKATSTNIGRVLTKAMRAVASANDELRRTVKPVRTRASQSEPISPAVIGTPSSPATSSLPKKA